RRVLARVPLQRQERSGDDVLDGLLHDPGLPGRPAVALGAVRRRAPRGRNAPHADGPADDPPALHRARPARLRPRLRARHPPRRKAHSRELGDRNRNVVARTLGERRMSSTVTMTHHTSSTVTMTRHLRAPWAMLRQAQHDASPDVTLSLSKGSAS